MCLHVDAARVPGHNLKTALEDCAAERSGVLQASLGRIARSAHADTTPADKREVAPPKEERRRLAKVEKLLRILIVSGDDD
jgi:hypothetical protein